MAGIGPAIHEKKLVDPRAKPGEGALGCKHRSARRTGSKTMKSILAIAVATVCGFFGHHYDARAEFLGTTFPGTPLPIDTPSTDRTAREIQVEQKPLLISRNYLWSAEKTSMVSLTSAMIKVLLPDMAPLTQANRNCFTNYRESCFRDVVTIGLLNERIPTTAAQQIQNLQIGSGLIDPNPVPGPCGGVLYTPKLPRPGYIVFEYLLKNINDDAEPTLLRCAQDGIPHPLCNGYAHHNGISYFYNFDRHHICEWDVIRSRIDTLIASFQKVR